MSIKIFIATLFLFFLIFSSVNGQTISDTSSRTTVIQQKDTADILSTSGDDYEEDDFSPGLLFFALIGIGLVCICIGIGVALVAFGVLIVLGLLTIGALSASLLVALHQKSVAKGFKALVLISSGILGIGVGSATLYLFNKVFNLQIQHYTALMYGAVSGLIGGLLLGLLIYIMIGRLIGYFKQRLGYTSFS